MADFNRNPNGLGGFKPGEIANPGGRPKSQSRVQLWFLKHALEAGGIIVDLARHAQGTKAEAQRFAAAREILDRSIGKASQAIDLAVDLSVNKKLDEMTVDELQEFRAKYAALTTAAPLAIEHVLADDEPEQLPLLGDEATASPDAVEPVEAETVAPPRPRGRHRRRPASSTATED
jgi:hypothetical protein